jgi:hypothetical protein
MREEQDYIQDIAEIRSMMERSTKFLSLSGWAGIMAGIYALAGALIAYQFLGYNPTKIVYRLNELGGESSALTMIIVLAILILVLAIGTAIFLSYKKANKRGEQIWNATSRRLVINMAVPLLTGGVLILILLSKNLMGLAAPLSLIFYGLAIYNASKFTFDEMKFLGLIQIGLGLISSYYIEFSLFLWSLGFGVVHIIYGVYMYFQHER